MFNNSKIQQSEMNTEADQAINTESYQDALADVTRQQFEDYKSRFLPVQEHLFSLATSDQLLQEQLERNDENIDRSFATAKQNEKRTLARFGVAQADSRQSKNNHGLQKSLATASINNETRSAVDDIQDRILTGQSGKTQTLAQMGRT